MTDLLARYWLGGIALLALGVAGKVLVEAVTRRAIDWLGKVDSAITGIADLSGALAETREDVTGRVDDVTSRVDGLRAEVMAHLGTVRVGVDGIKAEIMANLGTVRVEAAGRYDVMDVRVRRIESWPFHHLVGLVTAQGVRGRIHEGRIDQLTRAFRAQGVALPQAEFVFRDDDDRELVELLLRRERDRESDADARGGT